MSCEGAVNLLPCFQKVSKRKFCYEYGNNIIKQMRILNLFILLLKGTLSHKQRLPNHKNTNLIHRSRLVRHSLNEFLGLQPDRILYDTILGLEWGLLLRYVSLTPSTVVFISHYRHRVLHSPMTSVPQLHLKPDLERV